MPSPETLALFAVTSLGVLLIPGPAVTYLVARSVDQGRAAGLASVAGLGLGTMAHVLAATLGVSAVIASSALAFSALKYLGAGYLIAIGIRTWLRNDDHAAPVHGNEPEPITRGDLWKAFRQGVVVNVLNPKTGLFFLAFLPQFVDADAGATWIQLFVLGTTFVLLGLCTDGGYALLASRLGSWLRERPSFARRRRYVTGGVYVTLGVAAAITGGTRARTQLAVPA
ncbi:MAG TPA: LysE family translocator [Actinomycetota bacterium]|nr:LysE family translocator [Actinomycetota bacterium]